MRSGVGSRDGVDDVAAGIIAEGFIRVGNDADSDLRVKLLAVEGRLSLISDKMELGVWTLPEVLIEPFDLERFDLTIDGETIAFFPDAPREFSNLKIVSTRTAHTDRSPKPLPSEPEPSSAPDTPPRRQRSRQRRIATRQARAEKAQARQQARRAAKELRTAERRNRKRRRRERPHPRRDRFIESGSSSRRRAEDALRVWRTRSGWRVRLAWYRLVDELRRVDFFPFDRIPVVSDEQRREPGHEHSFEPHAAPAGIIREICSCGKIRLSSVPIELEGPAWLRAARSGEDTSE